MGPLLEASAAGLIQRAPRLEDTRLSIDIEILRMDAILEPLLNSATPRRTAAGLPRFEFEGTWARPALR